MDLPDVHNKIMEAKNSLMQLLIQVPCNMGTKTIQDARLTHFCATGHQTIRDASFLASSLSWLESLNIISVQKGIHPIRVEFPDFSAMKWLADPITKADTFSEHLEHLLDDIQSLGIASDTEEFSGTLTHPSTSMSDWSSVEVLDYNYDDEVTYDDWQDLSKDLQSIDEYIDYSTYLDINMHELNTSAKSTELNQSLTTVPLCDKKSVLCNDNHMENDENGQTKSILQSMSIILNTENKEWLAGTYTSTDLQLNAYSPIDVKPNTYIPTDLQPNANTPTASQPNAYTPTASQPSVHIPTNLKTKVISPLKASRSSSLPKKSKKSSSKYGAAISSTGPGRYVGIVSKVEPPVPKFLQERMTEQSMWLASPLQSKAGGRYLCSKPDLRTNLNELNLLRLQQLTKERVRNRLRQEASL